MKFENRKILHSLIHSGRLEEHYISEAISLAGIPPHVHSFLAFLRLVLVWVGALSLVMALLMFMAFNWQDLGRFTKFMMLEAGMLASIAVYFLATKYERVQQIALLLASITLGILLALIGQTYQTGADPWQLFAFWALLMTPWAVVANTSVLWILWIVLVNVAAVLYYQKLDLSFFSLLSMSDNLLLLLFGVNLILWVILSVLSTKYEIFKQVLSLRFLAFLTISAISTLGIVHLYEYINSMTMGYILLYLATLGLWYYFYRIREIDLYMMSLFAVSIFFFLLNFVIKFIIINSFDGFRIFDSIVSISLLLILVIGGLSTAIMAWMKHLKKEYHEKS